MIFIAWLGLLLLAALSVFQMLLVTGKPMGAFAWGGQHEVLSNKLRVASLFSIILYVAFGIFLASKAGITDVIQEGAFLNAAMWVLTGYFVLGILMNAISRSHKERMVMTPVAFLLAVVFLLVTLN